MEKCPLEKVLEDTIKDYREWNFLKTEEGLESLVGKSGPHNRQRPSPTLPANHMR
jgi:hypothetical protein